MLSFIFSSISLFYAFLFLFFCALCFISSNYIVLYVTLFQCHAWGFISAMELVGHSRLTHQCHCRCSLWAGAEYIAPFLRVKALGKFRFVLRFSGIFTFCLSLALFRPKALLQGWFLKNLEL